MPDFYMRPMPDNYHLSAIRYPTHGTPQKNQKKTKKVNNNQKNNEKPKNKDPEH